jgi:hypothetical protein
MRAAGDPAVENGAQISSGLARFVLDLRPLLWLAGEGKRPACRRPRCLRSGVPENSPWRSPEMKALFSEDAFDGRLPDSAPPELREAFASEPACAGFNETGV